MAHVTPQVSNDGLTLRTGQIISLGSSAWWRWLDAAETTTFHFKDQQGNFTGRRERKNGSWYWYAYRKHHGRLYKAYLGKSEELTSDRLTMVAQLLVSQIAAAAAPIYGTTPTPALAAMEGASPEAFVASSA